jgi:hypothetical protein
MTPTKRFWTFGGGALLALALSALTPGAAFAQAGECNGFINISYPAFPPSPLLVPPATEFDMQINLGTGSITGGAANVLIIDSFKLSMACNADFPLIPTCTPDGPPGFPPAKVEFVSMVQPMCGTSTFSPTVGGLGNNEVTFTADMPVVMPANQPTLPGFCAVRFRLRALQGFSSDLITPNDIEETVKYNIALCDNGVLVSGGTQTSSIPVMPPMGTPFIAYQIKRQGIAIPTGGTIDIPLLGLVGEPIDPNATAAAKRLLTPGVPANVNGDHLLGFATKKQGQTGGGFPLPTAPIGRQVTATTMEFGTVTKKLGGPWFVLTNAKKDLQNPVPPQPLTDVYACYLIDGPERGLLNWADQFGPATGILKGNQSICFPASLMGTAPPVLPLLCVNARWKTRPPLYQSGQLAFVGSAWLTDDVSLEGVDEYCAAVTAISIAP